MGVITMQEESVPLVQLEWIPVGRRILHSYEYNCFNYDSAFLHTAGYHKQELLMSKKTFCMENYCHYLSRKKFSKLHDKFPYIFGLGFQPDIISMPA